MVLEISRIQKNVIAIAKNQIISALNLLHTLVQSLYSEPKQGTPETLE
jgi:hypothetical protein